MGINLGVVIGGGSIILVLIALGDNLETVSCSADMMHAGLPCAVNPRRRIVTGTIPMGPVKLVEPWPQELASPITTPGKQCRMPLGCGW